MISLVQICVGSLCRYIEFQGDVELIRYHSNLINDDIIHHQRYNSDVNLNIPTLAWMHLEHGRTFEKKYALLLAICF